MAGDALLESNEHPEASIQKVDAVRTIDRYIRKTILETNSVRCDLVDQNHDNRLYRFHAHLGDYAGAICNELKNSGKTPHLSPAWILLVKDLDEFDSQVARWIDCSGAKTTGKLRWRLILILRHGSHVSQLRHWDVRRGRRRGIGLHTTAMSPNWPIDHCSSVAKMV